MTWNGDKRHCPKGHPYFGSNLIITPSTGHRVCRECRATNKKRNRNRVILAQQTLREEVKRLEKALYIALAERDNFHRAYDALLNKRERRTG